MDEALIPSTQRLMIGRSNLRLPSDIQSKELTLQLVYDVLRRCPFFKAFLVTADVLEIYMQDFWATAYVHQQSIQFKMNNKKHIVNLDSFRDMLHISPRIPCQSFDELPFEEEILEFIRFLGHSATIRTLTDVNINKLYQPWRSFAAIIKKYEGTGSKLGVPDVPTNESEEELLWNFSDDEGADDQETAKYDKQDDAEGGGNDEDESKSDEEDDNEETKEEENFNYILCTPESSEDEGDGEEDQEGSSVSSQFVTSMLNLTSDVGQVKEQISRILPRIKQSVNAQLEAEVLTRSSHSLRTSYAVVADLSEMELKKILIEKIEGNKSIQRSDEQRNLYKALVDAYEADKTILDSYGEIVILKRRCDDDDDQDEGPSAGSDW
nr:hypothetical protein [Tanacetum cinerariifolium]